MGIWTDKKIDTDSKAIQQTEFAEKIKNLNNAIIANESMFFLTFLGKIKKTRLKLYEGTATAL